MTHTAERRIRVLEFLVAGIAVSRRQYYRQFRLKICPFNAHARPPLLPHGLVTLRSFLGLRRTAMRVKYWVASVSR